MGSLDFNFQISLINFLFCILGSILVLFLANIIYEIKPNIKVALITIIILAAVTAVTSDITTILGSYYIIIKYIKPFIVLTVKIFSLKYLLKISFKQSIIICTFISLMMIFSEITLYFLMQSQNYKPTDALDSAKNFAISNTLIYVIAFIIAFLGKGLNIISKLPRNIRPKAYRNILINIAIAFVIIYPNAAETLFDIDSNFLKAIFLLAVIASLAMDVFSINNFAKTEINEQELELQKFYNNSMSEIIDRLRMYKHDTGNMLNTINGYIKLQRFDKLTEYMNEVTSSILKTDNLIAIKNINNAALYGIISSKINRAAEYDMHMQVIIIGEINEIPNIKISSLCEILGIYLDNAIEACIDSSKKIINLTIKDTDDSTEFLIENSFNEDMLKLDKLGQQGYSTKGTNRGMGLYIVNKLLERNKKVTTSTTAEHGYFIQRLVIQK